MPTEVVRKPILLMETVCMLEKYVNAENFMDVLNRTQLQLDSGLYPTISRKAQRLQQIMDTVCAGLDVESPVIQRYF